VLICGEKIVGIEDHLSIPANRIIDGQGMRLIPGVIDQHIHLTGGGGEGGFHTRTPEVQLTDLIKAGITTVVGLLGTDSISRSVEDLLAKTKALTREGVTAYCLTGAYTYPSPTLTGSVQKDIAFIEEMLGLKLALSDHRSSQVTKEELLRLASEVRVGSLLGEKPGLITLHMGDEKKGLSLVFDIMNETDLPATLFRPTHVTRTEALFHDALTLLKRGGWIDLTVMGNGEEVATYLSQIRKLSLDEGKVTFSSDGNGSYSSYGESGELIEIGVAPCDGILKTIQNLVRKGEPLDKALPFGTLNVANALGLKHKGAIEVGKDADLLLMDDALELNAVMAKGTIMMQDKRLVTKGTFE